MLNKSKDMITVRVYCYFGTRSSPCPFWSLRDDKPEQDNGYCSYLESGDWDSEGLGLLWDQVKLRVANDVWETLDGIESAINEVLEPFWKHVTRVWSLLGNTWLTRGVIIFLQHRLE